MWLTAFKKSYNKKVFMVKNARSTASKTFRVCVICFAASLVIGVITLFVSEYLGNTSPLGENIPTPLGLSIIVGYIAFIVGLVSGSVLLVKDLRHNKGH